MKLLRIAPHAALGGCLNYRLPCRPIVKFLVMYVAKLGFMDRAAGFAYSVLMAFYEYLIVLKVRELEAGLRECHKGNLGGSS